MTIHFEQLIPVFGIFRPPPFSSMTRAFLTSPSVGNSSNSEIRLSFFVTYDLLGRTEMMSVWTKSLPLKSSGSTSVFARA